jgi:hypothetical protein
MRQQVTTAQSVGYGTQGNALARRASAAWAIACVSREHLSLRVTPLLGVKLDSSLQSIMIQIAEYADYSA